jgi:hypothetical protein
LAVFEAPNKTAATTASTTARIHPSHVLAEDFPFRVT